MKTKQPDSEPCFKWMADCDSRVVTREDAALRANRGRNSAAGVEQK